MGNIYAIRITGSTPQHLIGPVVTYLNTTQKRASDYFVDLKQDNRKGYAPNVLCPADWVQSVMQLTAWTSSIATHPTLRQSLLNLAKTFPELSWQVYIRKPVAFDCMCVIEVNDGEATVRNAVKEDGLITFEGDYRRPGVLAYKPATESHWTLHHLHATTDEELESDDDLTESFPVQCNKEV